MKLIDVLHMEGSSDEVVTKLVSKYYQIREFDLTVGSNINYSEFQRNLFYFLKALVRRHHRIRYKFYNATPVTKKILEDTCQYINVKIPVIT